MTTRHTVFQPKQMTPSELEAGYWRAYHEFYRWSAIWRGASAKSNLTAQARHIAYAAGWKKFEPLWDWLIRAKRVAQALPLLETVLDGLGFKSTHSTADQSVITPASQPAIEG